ncbi:MAG: NAD(P)-binding protein [Chloroflexi bacterium]|nr:NAD(P)-binding protein [Chloroflexota bacterium]MYI03411.1 NAD(P)-binding protein [Chloroflexota bacterium]
MTDGDIGRYDVAIVGAGPVGSVCAIAHARKGYRVALFEANPAASKRLAGEWLHPPAVRVLSELGISVEGEVPSTSGEGFAVFPEDGREPIVLPYADGSRSLVCEHAALVSHLRQVAGNEPGVDLRVHARVRSVEDGRITFMQDGVEHTALAERIVGADGRSSVVRRSLGLSTQTRTCSRMIGLTLKEVDLPLEGYGHVLSGAPGPMLIYRLNEDSIRAVIDIPLDLSPHEWKRLLSDSYARWVPEPLRPAFLDACTDERFDAAANVVSPRLTYGTSRRVLIGDAAGHYHPLTATGMTLGFGDAFELAEGEEFSDFRNHRFEATRVPELLAMGIYEAFADQRVEGTALRQAMYSRWRASSGVRGRTMRLLGCEDTRIRSLSREFSTTVLWALRARLPKSFSPNAWREYRDVARGLSNRLAWLLRAAWHLYSVRRAGGTGTERPTEALARAFLTSMPSGSPAPDRTEQPGEIEVDAPDASLAVQRAVERLLNLQTEDGGWEGEMVWCPMITAQWVLLQHILGRPIDPDRRRRLLRYFEQSRLADGQWGLHDHSAPHLFVTTLVYVAVRVLGIERDDPLIAPALRFIQAEGALGIPSWGKFWLALLNLYDWDGLHPVLPELWSLPRRLPLHPSKWYCHTRLIYMAMAAIFARRFQAAVTPLIGSLREELYPQGYETVDFPAARSRLRTADLFAAPTVWLRTLYRGAQLVQRFHLPRLRERSVDAMVEQIKWELNTTDHTSISPVSGLLNILALWLHDPEDPDAQCALEQAELWFWEDEQRGARLTGAKSASWDSGFALQALATATHIEGVPDALERGREYLGRQQIVASFPGYREAYRNDPQGGWCFAERWHGWPVSDCTAEAVLGIVAADRASGADPAGTDALRDGVRFMLRAQNRDGGFGSYEAQRSRFDLERINPAEMFGESMTEHSYVECAASCMAAIAAWRRAATAAGREHAPNAVDADAERALERADAWLRRTQGDDGSWRGVWGVQYIYGTFFGIRGLLAGGAPPGDPALRSACRWLLDRQRDDGGWGEHHSGCLSGQYVPHDESQVIQTAWALIALLEAGDEHWSAIARGARFLVDSQCEDGGWARQDMAGVFFRTALLDYVLYRQYFPLHALGLYEARRTARHVGLNDG